MKSKRSSHAFPSLFLAIALSALVTVLGGCGGTPPSTPVSTLPPVQTYVLTVDSMAPASGVSVTASPADNGSHTSGSTSFTLTYKTGTAVALTAPPTASGSTFSSWSGCISSSGTTCNVTLTANTTVSANYMLPAVASVNITPNPASAVLGGGTTQFSATVSGSAVTNNAVTWTLSAPAGSGLSAGTLTSTGLYTTPYPAPPTVTVTATSVQNTSVSGSVTVTLDAPAATAGPALSVDTSNQTHAINPYIYGVNGYLLDTASESTAQPSLVRWGGSSTSRFNYKLNTTNAASSFYFENFNGINGMWGGSTYPGFITASSTAGTQSLMTMPMLGWVSNSSTTACSFTKSQFPGQTSFDTYNTSCGDGIVAQGVNGCTNAGGCALYGDSAGTIAALTSVAAPAPAPPAASNATLGWALSTWAGGWVNSVLTNYGKANPAGATGKSVAIWDLDNEPTYWDGVHRDVHPVAFTYDEVTNDGIGTAVAIKTVDSTAQVSGPVIDSWFDYFYSMKDIETGYTTGPCYQQWSGPIDRKAHGGVPLIEYYLQQMAVAQNTYGYRLLDYVDIHAYFAANYNGTSVGLTTAGDTGAQMARMNSTRAYWDPTYTASMFPQPNYVTDANYTSSCNTPLQAPQAIPMMKAWVARDYPGTKIAIDEYNFGGLEAINGAVTQADVLGIFGREGLDLGMLWPTTNYNQQVPGNFAFAMYRNYDGKQSTFGDMALSSTSADQTKLAVYGGLRTKDGSVTIMVVNKTYGDLSATLSINALATVTKTAQAYLYSNANLAQIVGPASVTVVPPSSGSAPSTLSTTFPAQSITLLVMPH